MGAESRPPLLSSAARLAQVSRDPSKDESKHPNVSTARDAGRSSPLGNGLGHVSPQQDEGTSPLRAQAHPYYGSGSESQGLIGHIPSVFTRRVMADPPASDPPRSWIHDRLGP
jgi:hypothetical protein